MCAVTNPLVNSYKRLVSGYEAPVYIAWSASNAAVDPGPRLRGIGTASSCCNPDPSANPYLVLALCLAARGWTAIRRGLMPPSSTDSNIFELSGDEREERDIHSLPSNLKDAVRAMRRDELVRETLGEHIFGKYVEHKTEEWDEYKIRVTPWELDRYLERY